MMTNYIAEMEHFNSLLNRDYKKANGVFYTDFRLADVVVSSLSIPKDATVLDPCCGTGSFIFSFLQNGIKNVFGADNDRIAVAKCKKNLVNAKIKLVDTLNTDTNIILKALQTDNLFDYIVGNPPYLPINKAQSKNKEPNLFVIALKKALEMVKIEGIVSYIVPKNFLHVNTYGSFRKEMLNTKTILSIVDIGAYFKDVRGEQIVLTIKNSPPKNNKIAINKLINDKFVPIYAIPQSFFSDTILIITNKIEHKVYIKMCSLPSTLESFLHGYVGRGRSKDKDSVSGKEIRKFGFKDGRLVTTGNQIFIQNIYSAESGIIGTFAGNLNARETVTIITDGNKKICKFLLGLLHSKICNFFLYKFCFNNSKLTIHADASYLKKIPMPIPQNDFMDKIIDVVELIEKADYMSDIWFDLMERLNLLIYNLYGLNENEVDYINAEMQKVFSKKWNKYE